MKPFGFQHDVWVVLLAHGCLGLLNRAELDEGEADGLLVLETDVLDGAETSEEFSELVFAGLGK